jgi:hypothetical protein
MQKNEQNTPELWKNSVAKSYLQDKLESTESNWIQELVEADASGDPKLHFSTINAIHSRHELFRPYAQEKFRNNFRALKKKIDKTSAAVAFDQKAFEMEAMKYPKNISLNAGYPRWDHPNNSAKKHLENDLKDGGIYKNGTMKPSDLRNLRPEYNEFPPDVFRSRIYRELRREKEGTFWQHKRNKKMRKKAVDAEVRAITSRESAKSTADTTNLPIAD